MNYNDNDYDENTDSGSYPSIFDLKTKFNCKPRLGRRHKPAASSSAGNPEPARPSQYSSASGSEAQTHPINPGSSSLLNQFGKPSTLKPNFPYAQSVEKIDTKKFGYRNVEMCKKNLQYEPPSSSQAGILATKKKYPFFDSSSSLDKENVAPSNAGRFTELPNTKSVPRTHTKEQVDEIVKRTLQANFGEKLPKEKTLESNFARETEQEKNKALYPNLCFVNKYIGSSGTQKTYDEPFHENQSKTETPAAGGAHQDFKFPALPTSKSRGSSPDEKVENNSADSSQDSGQFETAVMSTSRLCDSPMDLSSHSTSHSQKSSRDETLSKSSSMEVTNTILNEPLQSLDLSILNFPNLEPQNNVFTRIPTQDTPSNHHSSHPAMSTPSSQHHLARQEAFLRPYSMGESYPDKMHVAHSTPVRQTTQPASEKSYESTPVFKRPLCVNPSSSYKQHQELSTPHSEHSQETVKHIQDKVSSETRETKPEIGNVQSSSVTANKKSAEKNTQQDILTVNSKQYRVLTILGKGGSSSVYLVQEITADEEFKLMALKVVNLSSVTDESIAEGYLNEVKLLVKLQGCPCVITMFDYEYDTRSKYLYVVMEKGDCDLSKYMKNITKMSTITNTMFIIMKHWHEMLLAVKEIHANGIIHSDLKPANFLFVGGVLKIIDFGIASSLQGDMTSVVKEVASGTVNYMSPEAISQSGANNSHRITYKSDIWSLGCILYNMIYGRTPYSHVTHVWAKMQAIANNENKVELKTELPNKKPIPPILLNSMKLCLQKDPKSRPTAAELLEILETRLSTI